MCSQRAPRCSQSLGRLDEALALEEAVVRRDPVNVNALFNLGYYQRMAGRLDAAIASFRTAAEPEPEQWRRALPARRGAAAEGRCAGRAGGDRAGDERDLAHDRPADGLPRARAQGRLRCGARCADREVTRRTRPSNIAYVYAFRGEADQAFAWLDKAVEYGDPGLGEIVTENLFDKIHGDPRWLPFLRKIGKAPEQLAEIEFKVKLPQ